MFNLGPTEIIVIVVLAILIFGDRLPQVAAEAAGWIMKLKRSMSDLRRDSGIDREISEVRRAVENAVPREVRQFDASRSIESAAASVKRDVADPVVKEFQSAHDALREDRREATNPPVQEPALTPEAEDPAARSAAKDSPHP